MTARRSACLTAVLLSLIAACAAPASQDSQPPAPATSSAATVSPIAHAAEVLAEDDGGSDTTSYEDALRIFQAKCKQDMREIALYTENSRLDLEKNNVHGETDLSLLQHVGQSVAASPAHMDCQGLFAAYLILREQS